VKFPWDNNPIGKSTISNGSWIRCSQNLSGKEYGMWMIPKVGQEVMVGFFNNDIDCPVVMGTLYNESEKPMNNQENYKKEKVELISNTQ
jgi:type VI secretion system secreted protein VgrG